MGVFADRAKAKIKVFPNKPKILFTEGWNEEIQKAANFLKIDDLIEPVLLLRDKNDLNEKIKNLNTIIISEIDKEKYSNYFYELRKSKGVSIEEATKYAIQPHYISTLLLKEGTVDGVVCGIEYTTKDTLRAALQIIKTRQGCKLVTSAMMLERDGNLMVFGDCSLALNPSSEELAEITKELMLFSKNVLSCSNLNTAMLSYSTAGSGAGESVDKVKKAYELTQQMPELADYKDKIYGEIQFDAAFVETVRTKKAKDCKWNSRANIFVFPTLDAGNIGYKIAERCGNFLAIGPVILGLDKPMNDLSRGASAQSVIEIAYITASQIENK